LNKNESIILNLLPKLAFLIAMSLMVGALAKGYSYFKTGASHSDLLSQSQQEKLIHDPVITWDLKDDNQGVELDDFTRQKIQDAYIAAWYILNRSTAKQTDLGLADKYSVKMVDKISKTFAQASNYLSKQVDLEHHLKVHLFSYDRQIVSFSDQRVKVARAINDFHSDDQHLVYDTMSFDIVMGLEDGYWKVFEMIQLKDINENDKSTIGNLNARKEIVKNIKGINYYPSDHPWLDFWPNYKEKTTRQDLNLARKLGFNHVRIFIPYTVFGKGTMDAKMISYLDHFLDTCKEKELTVTLSLFDFPESYHLNYYSATRKHFIQLLERYKDHQAVVLWDLKNEADLDFQHYGEQVVMNWLQLMIKTANDEASHINITVGWSDLQYAHYLSDELDILSFHLYKDIEEVKKNFQSIKELNLGKAFYVSEFGKTTFQSTFLPFGSTAKEQAVYTKEVLDFLSEEKINHHAYWTLYDFEKAPKEVMGSKPWIRNAQKNMGLVTTDGKLKPAIINYESKDGYQAKLKWHDAIKPFYLLFIIGFILSIFLLKGFYRK